MSWVVNGITSYHIHKASHLYGGDIGQSKSGCLTFISGLSTAGGNLYWCSIVVVGGVSVNRCLALGVLLQILSVDLSHDAHDVVESI